MLGVTPGHNGAGSYPQVSVMRRFFQYIMHLPQKTPGDNQEQPLIMRRL